MRVVIVNPAYGEDFCRSARWAARSRGRVQRHPDWLLIAAAVLEKAGHTVSFVEGAALNLSQQVVLQRCREFRPDLVVIHTTTPSIYSDLDYARQVKQRLGCLTALVGPHVTAVPDDTFTIADGAVDFIARGEYDYTLRDLADGLSPGTIPGLSYQQGGVVHHNPDRMPLDVNELPFPAWHHVLPEWYRDGGKRFPFLTLISGRGCFGQCTFCRDTHLMYRRKLRLREPRLVVDEIEDDFRRFPYLREIMFETDTFTASPRHVDGVCQEILRRGLKVTWSCNARVDLDLSLLPLMKRAGCRMLMVGFEFGTQQALDAVRKGIALEQSRRFAHEASRLGFTLHGCFMIGAPHETPESALATIDFAKSLPLDTIQISGICTYPGTPLYDWARQNGYLVPKDWREWISPSGEQVTLLSYPNLTKDEIDAYIDRGLRQFYLRPSQMLRMLLAMRSLDDLRRKLFGFRSFVQYFTVGRAQGRRQPEVAGRTPR